ncbi:MAG: hypothetical protein HN785_05900 [Euryarchaeota archaeon]|jgi:hypothetical protein|nr:hypothetical protein [Euryarchaeota archaeon]MBT4650356.1 hypothetical protein [Euryarchaeota archaeon]MBT7433376.1 hypothetical protein [Euryarchaeota archaeon]
MKVRSIEDSSGNSAQIAVLLAFLMLLPIFLSTVETSELNDEISYHAGESPDLKLYTLYFAAGESTSDGEGILTTKVPESGGQETASALDEKVEFSTEDLLSTLDIYGRPQHGSSSGKYFLPINLFLKAVGPSNSNVEWTINIEAAGSQIGSTAWSTAACNTGIGNSCNFDHESFDVDLGATEFFTIPEDAVLEISVSAEMSGCDGGGGPFGSSCSAEVAWNEIDDETSRYSQIEVEANALSNSLVLLQREGAELAEGSELEWFPNDILEQRSMQFTFDVKSSFGRYDIDTIRLILRDPQGVYRIDHIITTDDQEIEDTNEGIFGDYLWTYPSGLPAGEYTVELEITDIQGNHVLIDHDPVEMHQFGVSINHRLNRQTEYIAPNEITPIPLQLVHRGDSTKSMTVELEVMTNLGGSWLVEFDSDSNNYQLDAGGDILNPILTLQAPDDLTGTPESIEIRAVAEAEVDGILTVVHQDTLLIDIEKIDVFQPPDVSVWSEDHDIPISNSSHPDSVDYTIPRYVEYNQFNPFLLEIFNTGFDSDTFRIDILQRSKSIIQVYDNDTGERILENEGDGTFHSAMLDRHSTQILMLNIKPSSDREDPDTGLIEIEIVSTGNASLRTTVMFTIQRTFGIRAEVAHDCDGSPLGHILVSLCSPGPGNAEVSMRVRIINSMTTGDSSTYWRIPNPATLDENVDRDSAYGQWQFNIADENGESVPRVSLGPGDFIEVFVTVTLTSQVEQGNHTVYLRIIEDTEDEDARYFDLPMEFEIDADEPNIQIVQVSPDRKLKPGEDYSIQMKVKNLGNSQMTLLLDADVEASGWEVEVDGPSGSNLIVLDAFDELTFNLKVRVPTGANNGDVVQVFVTATPLDTTQSWSDDYTAKKTVDMTVGLSSIISIIINEVTHPRPLTLVSSIVGILLIFAGIQSGLNRRRWASHMALIEALNNDEEEDEDAVEEDDIPAPVTSEIDDGVERYEDDEIELV